MISKNFRFQAVQCVESISKQLNQLNWTRPMIYANWLSQTYFYVRHATRVLCYAASHCNLEQEKLHLKLIQGIGEEQGHEFLALRDLKSLQFKIDQFQEFPETSAYYQTLYHNIRTDGPMSLLGYFISLEGLAAIGMTKMTTTIFNTYGDSKAEFLRMHCKVDERHFQEGLNFVCELEEAEIKVVEKYLILSSHLYEGLLQAVGRRTLENQNPTAP